jgi:hypothetical protein
MKWITRRCPSIIFRISLLATIFLGGFISFPFWYGLLIYTLPLPYKSLLERAVPSDLLPGIWLPISVLGGAIWGWQLARSLVYASPWRLLIACGTSVGIGMILANGPIQRLVNPHLMDTPFHIRFAVQFALGIGVVVILTGLALGIAVKSWKAAVWLAIAGSLAAVLPAIIVLFILDTLGIRVGSGNAAMAKVMVLGFLAATLAGGGLIGWILAHYAHRAGEDEVTGH